MPRKYTFRQRVVKMDKNSGMMVLSVGDPDAGLIWIGGGAPIAEGGDGVFRDRELGCGELAYEYGGAARIDAEGEGV